MPLSFKISFLIALLLSLLNFNIALAQGTPGGWVSKSGILDGRELIPDNCRGTGEDCKFPDDLLIFIANLYNLMIAVMGSIALLFFMYGGFLWIFAQGKPNFIEKGKNTLVMAYLGILIAMLSWILVNFVIAVFTGQTGSLDNVLIFGKPWWNR